jgi:hypothetical protein
MRYVSEGGAPGGDPGVRQGTVVAVPRRDAEQTPEALPALLRHVEDRLRGVGCGASSALRPESCRRARGTGGRERCTGSSSWKTAPWTRDTGEVPAAMATNGGNARSRLRPGTLGLVPPLASALQQCILGRARLGPAGSDDRAARRAPRQRAGRDEGRPAVIDAVRRRAIGRWLSVTSMVGWPYH